MRSFFLLIIMSTVFFAATVFAMNGRTTYQAKIVKPDGYPLEAASVNFRFTVLDSVGSCVLYVEDYTGVNMSGGSGLISFALGNGTRSFPVSGTSQTFAQIFDNSVPLFNCQTPGAYNPGPNDTRKIVMQFNDGSGWQTLPAMAINAVPYAMYANKSNDAQTLNGKPDTAFVENATLAALNCNPATQAITFNGVSFSCVAISGGGGGITSVTTSGTVLTTAGTASSPVISINVASMSSDGYLTSLDYAEFKAKLSASATQIANTLGYAPVSASAVAAQISSTNLSGDVSGSISSNSVVNVGGKTAAQISSSVDDTLAATSSSTVDTIVKRNSSGNVTVNDLYANAAKINYTDIYRPSTSFNIRLQAPTSLSANYILNLPTTSGTAGQVLSTDGLGNLSWINQSTTSAAIIAALGYTPAASGTSLGDFKKDGSVAMTGQLQAIAGNANAPAYTFNGDTNTGIYSSGADQISIATSGTDRLWIDGSGVINLGSGFEIDGYTVYSDYPFQLNGSAQATGYSFSNGPAIYSPSVNKLIFTTGGIDLTINPNGNVGIGTSSPSAKLHLAPGTSSMASFKFTSGTLLTSPQSGTMEYDGSFFYLTDGSNTRRAIATGSSAGTLDNASNINSSGNMTITPTGSVIVSSTTASTSSDTGALIVRGGLGVAGNVNTSGSITTSANIQGVSVTATSGMISPYIAGSIVSGGSLVLDSTTHANKGNILLAPNSGYVGIGTNTPNSVLSIGSNIGTGYAITANSTTPYGAIIQTSEGAPSSNAAFWVRTTPDSGATINTLFRVQNNGNVGIGTANPTADLTVFDKGGANENALGIDGAAGTHREVSFMTSGVSRWIMGVNDASESGSNAGSNFYLNSYNDAGAYLATNFSINRATGNVGIGTNAPQRRLVVREDSGSTNTALYNAQTTGASIVFSMRSDTTGVGASAFQEAGGVATRVTDHNHATYSGDLEFFNAGAGAVSTKMIIKGSGNVGIGTQSPSAKLHIVDESTAMPRNLVIDNYSVGGNAAQIWGRAARGNSGAPTAVQAGDPLLNLIGGAYDGTSFNEVGHIRVIAESNQSSSVHNSFIEFTTASGTTLTEQMRITSNGNVGIGTVSPNGKLNVLGDWNGSYGAVTLQGDKPTIRFSSTSGTIGGGNHWLIHQGNGDSTNPGSLDFYQSTDGTAWGISKLKIAPSGNVGIGTNTPVTKLQIGSPFSGVVTGWSVSRTMGVMMGDDSDNFYIGLENNGSNEKYATLIWGDDGTEPLLFKTNDANGVVTERARMTANGNFGVGTTNPSARVSVYGFAAAEKGLDVMAKYNCPSGDTTGTCGVTDENTGVNTLQRWGFSTHPDTWNLALKRNHQAWGNVSYDFVAKDSGTETTALSIKYNGNVGIATVSATAKLHIDNTTANPNVLPGFKVENSINGTTGSGMTIDTGQGQGLTNLVGGAVIASDGTGYKYLGARGASRILLGDGTISFFTGNTAIGTANQTVTWSGAVPESLHISSAGYVGIGITTPNEKLHVVGNLRVQGSTDCTLGNGAGGTNCSSDARLKENVKPIPYALEKINSLKGVEFDWNEKSLSHGRHDIGVIAQDVEKVFPTAVMNDKNTGYKKVDYAVLVAPVIQAVKELYAFVVNRFEKQDRQIASKADSAEVQALKTKTEKLESENLQLKQQNETIKAYLCNQNTSAPFCN
ncbi:MAG: tail fiber domain-containing protein [Pseudobdellovibrio sp.]|nr:tail fiber domain-containing protein [Pseudobdellovibrio sp.]